MDMLRQKTLEFQKTYGSPIQWFADKLGCSHTHFSQYLKGTRPISQEKEEILRDLIENPTKYNMK